MFSHRTHVTFDPQTKLADDTDPVLFHYRRFLFQESLAQLEFPENYQVGSYKSLHSAATFY